MASPAVQAKANALNAKMEAEAGSVLDSIERTMIRKVARHSFKCAVDCYDKAGETGAAESLDGCARNCQAPYQQTQQLVQNVRMKMNEAYLLPRLLPHIIVSNIFGCVFFK
jgi:hypothetical protein